MRDRVLVTGAAGFIGWKVSELLLASGYRVVGVDNFNDAYDVRLKEWRLGRLRGNPGFSFERLDITDRVALRGVFEREAADVARGEAPWSAVLNLAARAGVRQSVENPWIYYETNVTGTLNLLELCREFGVQKFVQASSSSVYGSGNSGAFREDGIISRPLSPYAASKLAAEALCYTYHYLYGLDVTVLRYFTVYGPAGRPDMSPFRFVQWILEGRPVKVFGDGSQRRDFTYVDDIAAGTVAALRRVGFEIINLGSDKPVVLREVIRVVEELAGCRAAVEYSPRHPADVLSTWANIEKAEKLLGWRPKTLLHEGLRELVSWYRENRSWAREIVTS